MVKLPLFSLIALCLVFLVAIAHKLIGVKPDSAFGFIAAGVSLAVVAVGLMQTIAVPYALWMLLGIDRWTSPKHWMAVICGSVHFWFCLYYVYTSIFTPKH